MHELSVTPQHQVLRLHHGKATQLMHLGEYVAALVGPAAIVRPANYTFLDVWARPGGHPMSKARDRSAPIASRSCIQRDEGMVRV